LALARWQRTLGERIFPCTDKGQQICGSHGL
jgi:hypothetical protein